MRWLITDPHPSLKHMEPHLQPTFVRILNSVNLRFTFPTCAVAANTVVLTWSHTTTAVSLGASGLKGKVAELHACMHATRAWRPLPAA